jgi:hypothetical protein
MLRVAAEEGASFTGLLVDFVERAEPLTIRTTTERTHRGVIAAVGRDFAAVREPGSPPVLVALDAIASVRPSRGGRYDTAGDRAGTLDASFASVLAGAAGERATVQLGVIGEDALVLGVLRSVGRDIVTLRLEAASRPTIYVPVGAISEAVLLDLS